MDLMIGFFVLIMIFTSSIWLWDTAREKMYLAESRNQLELTARNAAYSLLQTVGDPPNWYRLADINETSVYSLGIGRNRPWFINEEKAKLLATLNNTHYDLFKKILTVRNNEFFLNVSRYNTTDKQFYEVSVVGKRPSASAEQVVRIERFGLSDYDGSWSKFIMYVWKKCKGAYC